MSSFVKAGTLATVSFASVAALAFGDGPSPFHDPYACDRVSSGSLRSVVAVRPPRAAGLDVPVSFHAVSDPNEIRVVVFYGLGSDQMPLLLADDGGEDSICRAAGFARARAGLAEFHEGRSSGTQTREAFLARQGAMQFPWGRTESGDQHRYRAYAAFGTRGLEVRPLADADSLDASDFLKSVVCEGPQTPGLVAERLRPGPVSYLRFPDVALPASSTVISERTLADRWGDYLARIKCSLSMGFPAAQIR